MDLQDLKKPFDPKLISWRVGSVTKDKKKAMPLAYIDARDVMERLDEVCGVDKWQCRYSHANGKTIAEIGIKVGDEWIWKANGAGDTQVEAEKGAISDAMKRAAVLWGIGRYLYDVPNIWVEIDEYKKIKNPNDPRLAKALENAARGIRGANEAEPQIQEAKPVKKAKEPLSGEQYLRLLNDIKEAETHSGLNSAREAVGKAFELYKPTKEQSDEIGKAGKAKFNELSPKTNGVITPDDLNKPIETAVQ